jgi:hypothetical protein
MVSAARAGVAPKKAIARLSTGVAFEPREQTIAVRNATPTSGSVMPCSAGQVGTHITPWEYSVNQYPVRRAPASAENFANFRQLPFFHTRLLSEYPNQYSTPGVVVN